MYSPKGFGFWAVELNPVSEITWLREGGTRLPKELKSAETENTRRNKPVQSSGKYAHLVKPLRSGLLIERGKFNSSGLTAEQLARQNSGEKPGPGNADHLIWMHGKDLEGLDVSIFWGFCSQAGIWRRGAGAHVHPTDEVLIYLGLDPNDSDYLGAEIEIDMGQEHERHIINKSSVVICPAGTPHMPQVTRWVDKPFAFFAINLSGEHETKSFD
jgi:hypothetical protein